MSLEQNQRASFFSPWQPASLPIPHTIPRKSASITEDLHLHLFITSLCFPCHASGFSTHTSFLSDLTYFSTLASTLVLTSKSPILLLTQSFHLQVLYLYCTLSKLTYPHVNFSSGVLSWGKTQASSPFVQARN